MKLYNYIINFCSYIIPNGLNSYRVCARPLLCTMGCYAEECEVPVLMLPPPALCDSLEKPKKQKAIAEHQTRFSQ